MAEKTRKDAVNREELSIEEENKAVYEVRLMLLDTYGPEVMKSTIWPVLFEAEVWPDPD